MGFLKPKPPKPRIIPQKAAPTMDSADVEGAARRSAEATARRAALGRGFDDLEVSQRVGGLAGAMRQRIGG